MFITIPYQYIVYNKLFTAFIDGNLIWPAARYLAQAIQYTNGWTEYEYGSLGNVIKKTVYYTPDPQKLEF